MIVIKYSNMMHVFFRGLTMRVSMFYDATIAAVNDVILMMLIVVCSHMHNNDKSSKF